MKDTTENGWYGVDHGGNPHGLGRKERVLGEVVQVAAMSQRFAEDLGFIQHD
jgi:hypothetical protein